jgi:tetratricopeptide (TPR) repeat protein
MAKLRALGYLGGEDSHSTQTGRQSSITQREVTPPAPTSPATFDRAEARRLNNLGTARGGAGDREGAEQAFLAAIEADPSYASSYYNLGLLKRKEGHLEESDRLIWKAVALGVADRELAVVRMALDYRQRGNMARAARVFELARRRFPSSAPIWINSGVFLGEQGRYLEARSCLEHAARLAPENVMVWVNLAAALIELGETEQARAALTQAAELDPSNQAVQAKLAQLGGPVSR